MWHLLRCCFALVGISALEVAMKFLSGSKYDHRKKGAFRMWNYDATPEVLQAMLDNGEFSDTTADVITGLQQLIRCMLHRGFHSVWNFLSACGLVKAEADAAIADRGGFDVHWLQFVSSEIRKASDRAGHFFGSTNKEQSRPRLSSCRARDSHRARVGASRPFSLVRWCVLYNQRMLHAPRCSSPQRRRATPKPCSRPSTARARTSACKGV